MSLDPPQPLPTEEPAPPPFPRLCIRDWLVGTLLCALLFTAYQRTRGPLEEWHGRPAPVFVFARSTIFAAEITVALTVLCLLVSRRSVSGFSSGHWLCVFAAVSVIGNLFDRKWGYEFVTLETYRVIAIFQCTAAAIALFAPAWLGRQPALWRTYFRLVFCDMVVRVLLYQSRARDGDRLQPWLERAKLVLSLCGVVIFITATAVEIARRRRMDWAHWVGVLSTPIFYVVWFAERPERVLQMIEYVQTWGR